MFVLGVDFVQTLIDLPKEIHTKLVKCLNLLAKNRRHPGLNVETLRAPDHELCSARVDQRYRVIFSEGPEDVLSLLFIGPHDQAYRYAARSARPSVGLTPPAERMEVREPEFGDETAPPAFLARTPIPPGRPLELDEIRAVVAVGTKKYLPIAHVLMEHPANSIKVTFAEIEKIIGDGLPKSARRYPAWWSNDPTHSHASAWMSVGWQTRQLNQREERVTFVRLAMAASSPLVYCD